MTHTVDFSEFNKIREMSEKPFSELNKFFVNKYELVPITLACTMVGLLFTIEKKKEDAISSLSKLDIDLLLGCLWLETNIKSFSKPNVVSSANLIKRVLLEGSYGGKSDINLSFHKLNDNFHLVDPLRKFIGSNPPKTTPLILSMLIVEASDKIKSTSQEVLADTISWQSHFLTHFEDIKNQLDKEKTYVSARRSTIKD